MGLPIARSRKLVLVMGSATFFSKMGAIDHTFEKPIFTIFEIFTVKPSSTIH